MAILGVDDFKSKLFGGGARSNLFKVEMGWPAVALAGSGESELAGFLIKAASLPSSVIAPIEVPFRGRKLQIAGDRTFEPWIITVINDSNFALRNVFEKWMDGINAHSANTGVTNTSDYFADASIYQLDKSGEQLKGYVFRGLWPSNLSAIDVSYETEGIQEFTVELQVQYWESDTTN
jgi:hypothetical protein